MVVKGTTAVEAQDTYDNSINNFLNKEKPIS